MQTNHQDPLLTREEVAARLRLRPQTLAKRECLGNPLLPSIRIGGRVRYRAVDVEDLILNNTQQLPGAAK